MPTNAQVADALRAMADLIDVDGPALPTLDAPEMALAVVAYKSTGRAQRIAAGMHDVASPEPYQSPTTRYTIYRGRLIGRVVEVMESQDD
jgi:hypothetical protein